MMNAQSTLQTMRIVRLDEVGPPENLKLVEQPVPTPGPGEILIRVALAGMIYGDTEARRGTYFKPTPSPFFPGREVAGEIVAVGPDVTGYQTGDRVLALILAYGCWADYVIAPLKETKAHHGGRIPPSDIVKLEPETGFAEALPYLVNFRLAHMLFHGSSKVPQGATVLVHGGAGGMGSMVIQLAVDHGCTVIATCRGAAEADYCRALGAQHVIDTVSEDYVAATLAACPGGVPYSFNGVGGDAINRDFDVLAPFGEIQAYGYVAAKTPFDSFRLGKSISLKTFSADDYLKTPMFPAATAAMHEWFRTRTLRGVDVILPLDQVVEANRLLDAGRVTGKIALEAAMRVG